MNWEQNIIDKGIINFYIRVISTLLAISINEGKSNLEKKKNWWLSKILKYFQIKNQNINNNKIYEYYQIYQKNQIEKYLSNINTNDLKFDSKGNKFQSKNLNTLAFNLLKEMTLPIGKIILENGWINEYGKISVGIYLLNKNILEDICRTIIVETNIGKNI